MRSLHGGTSVRSAIRSSRTLLVAVPLIAGIFGCKSEPPPSLKITPTPLISAPENQKYAEGMKCSNPTVRVDNYVCVTGCSEGTNEHGFNLKGPVIVADCSRDGFYHTFAVSKDGTTVLWEGAGDDNSRRFVRMENGIPVVLETEKYGKFWRQSGELLRGQSAAGTFVFVTDFKISLAAATSGSTTSSNGTKQASNQSDGTITVTLP